jgi:peptidoglycan/LPS O-acetylase OafA/YrhL
VSEKRTPAAGVRRYEALDSLRGVCACFVVLFHLRPHLGPTAVINHLAIVRNADQFVDFFFVLSGFVIAASYGAKLKAGFSLRAYMILRLGRIYPLHLVMLLAFVGLETGMLLLDFPGMGGRERFTGLRSLPYLAANLLLVQIFVPGAPASWNGPSWSIAAEIWTYALTAIGLSLLKQRFRLVLAAIVILVPLGYFLLDAGAMAGPGRLLFRCLFGFSIGMLAFDLHAYWSGGIGRAGATLAEAAALLASAAAIIWFGAGPFPFVSPFLFGLTILVLAREEGAASNLLMRAPMRCLGRWSYSIYMVHFLILTLVFSGFAPLGAWLGVPLITTAIVAGQPTRVIEAGGIVPDLAALASLALVIAVAASTYRLVELPFRNVSRRLAERVARRPLAAAERVAPTM